MSKITFGNPRLAVAYLRASKDEQRLSPEAQRTFIEAWAARERLRIIAWCIDQGVRSVSPIAERPELRVALAALHAHEAGVLVVAKRDRIARDVLLAAVIERAVARAGARVVSASGEGNGDSPADAFMRTVIDGAAQYEHGLIRARTSAALAAKRARGERIGSVPLGFGLGSDGARLIPVEHEQAAIARARELRASGLVLRAIATRFAAEGHVSRAGRPLAGHLLACGARALPRPGRTIVGPRVSPRRWVTRGHQRGAGISWDFDALPICCPRCVGLRPSSEQR
jgi:DNA invertase Pin-like site-specific DNA recombinase